MKRSETRCMFELVDETQDLNAPGEQASQADPYDGVALGVECAWPSEAQD